LNNQDELARKTSVKCVCPLTPSHSDWLQSN